MVIGYGCRQYYFPEPPAPAVTLISPADGTCTTTIPTFTWSSSVGAVSYTWQLATDSGFKTIILQNKINTHKRVIFAPEY